MQSDTQSITIAVEPKVLFEFLADPMNLPRWAGGLCSSVSAEGSEWIAITELGPVGLRCVKNAELGVIDYHISPPLPIKIAVYSRVIANGTGAEYVFTQFRPAFLPVKIFAKQVESLKEGLQVLKRDMESQ